MRQRRRLKSTVSSWLSGTNSEVFQKYVKTDEQGYIVTEGASTRTNVPGVFAAGDIMDPVYRQGIAAAGSGCRAAIDAERYLGELEAQQH